MTDIDLTTHPIEPVSQFTLNHDDPYHRLAFDRVLGAALEAYSIGHHDAVHYRDLEEHVAHAEGLSAALATAGRSCAAAVLNRVVHVLADKLDEDTLMALSDTAAALDLEVVEDLDGANGTGEDDEGPEVRVFHRADGWVFSFEPGTQPCTINRMPESDGKQDCAATAVWKFVEHRDLVLTLSTWCDVHLPAEHRHLADVAK